MIAVRRALAWPFYLVAISCHLLASLFGWLAQYISGDDFKQHSVLPPLTIIVALSIAVLVALAARTNPADRVSEFELVAPVTEMQKAPDYTAEERARVIPYIETMACLFATGALRYSLRPHSVGFVPCTHGSDYTVSFREDLGVATVAGQVEIDGAQHRFTALLNHYPPATDVEGFRAVKFEIDPPPG
jgi:hypothetical protein